MFSERLLKVIMVSLPTLLPIGLIPKNTSLQTDSLSKLVTQGLALNP